LARLKDSSDNIFSGLVMSTELEAVRGADCTSKIKKAKKGVRKFINKPSCEKMLIYFNWKGKPFTV
jgi:hypothetical protein